MQPHHHHLFRSPLHLSTHLIFFICTHMPCICLSVGGWLHTSWFSACIALPHSSSVSCFLKNSSSQFILGHPHFYFPFSLPPFCFAWLPVSSFFCHFSLFYPPFHPYFNSCSESCLSLEVCWQKTSRTQCLYDSRRPCGTFILIILQIHMACFYCI